MNTEYIYPKQKINKKDIDLMVVHFCNGDYVKIFKNEILDCDITFSDKMMWVEDSIAPLIKSGNLKCRINFTKLAKDHYARVWDSKTFRSDRKGYIEKRCLEDIITKVVVYDSNNWSTTLIGEIKGKVDKEYLILDFVDSKNLPNEKDYSTINLKDIEDYEIADIELDFENCDGIQIFVDEIEEFEVKFSKTLVNNGGRICREVDGGHIKIKLDKKIDYRDINLLMYPSNKKISLKHLYKRICDKGEYEHDICNLYINYYLAYSSIRKECITIKNLLEGNDDVDFSIPFFVGGVAKLQEDNSILISFGKSN